MLSQDKPVLKALPPRGRMPISKRVLGLLVLLVIGVLVLSGCAPRPTADLAAAHTADPAALVTDLPPLVIDVDEQGNLSIGNVSLAPRLSALHALMQPDCEMQAMHEQMTAQLAALSVPAPWLDFLQSSNIQSLQLNTHPEGVLWLVNGDPLPSVAWDTPSLQAIAQTLTLLGLPTALEQVLPLVEHLGVGVVVRFPVPAGETALPLYGQGDSHGAAEIGAQQAAFVQAVSAPPRITIPIIYHMDGSLSLGRLSDAEWTALTGMPVSNLQLDPALLDRLSQAGVERVSLSSNAEGIHVAVNGKTLPWLSWANGEMAHLLGVSEQLVPAETWLPGLNPEDILPIIYGLLQVVQSIEFDLTVYLSPPTSLAVATAQ